MAEKKKSTTVPWNTQAKQTIEQQSKEIAELREQLAKATSGVGYTATNPDDTKNSPAAPEAVDQLLIRIHQLEGMIEGISKTKLTPVSTNPHKPSEWLRMPTEKDIQQQTVTFSARGCIYVTSSYVKNNVTYISPFKPIEFVFAGSDRRRMGKEEDIINYCVYSTNLIAEIEFLRNHPLFGLAFSENLNEMLSQDAKMLSRLTSVVVRFRSMSNEVLFPMAHKVKLNVPKLGREGIIMELATRAVREEMQKEEEHMKNSFLLTAQHMNSQQQTSAE